jgi:hypothetical protein
MTRRVAFDVDAVRLDDIADALQDQETYEHHWTFDSRTGEVGFASRDLDGEDEEPNAELVTVEPYPSSVWYRDMADFAEGLSDERASRRLLRALDGRGAFRHFKNEIYEEYPELVSTWTGFRNARARRHAVEWLLDEDLIDETTAQSLLAQHPDPALP